MRSLMLLAALPLALVACHDRTPAAATQNVVVNPDADTNSVDECPRKDGTPCR